MNLSIFSKCLAPAGEFTLHCSLDNCPRAHLQARWLTPLILLTFILCWIPLLPAGSVVLVLSHHANWSLSQPQPHALPLWLPQCSSGSSIWEPSPSATKNLVWTSPAKKKEHPNKRFKPSDSWKYKQMWRQEGLEKQEKHSCNIHLPRTEYIQSNYSLLSWQYLTSTSALIAFKKKTKNWAVSLLWP